MPQTPISNDRPVGHGHIIISKLPLFLGKEGNSRKRDAAYPCVPHMLIKPALEIRLKVKRAFSC